MNKKMVAFGAVGALAVAAVAGTAVGGTGNDSGSGPGKVEIGVDIPGLTPSPPAPTPGFPDPPGWNSSNPTEPENGLFPIGGGGQINGEFVTAERNGIQVGIRAQQRGFGPIEAEAGKGKRAPATYQAQTGTDPRPGQGGRCWWNFDWHVDLTGAKGVAKDSTLGDYKAVVEVDMPPIVGDLPLQRVLEADNGLALGDGGNAVLYQNSWNATFFPEIDTIFCDQEGTYDFRVVLTPESFNGPPLAAAMTVEVAD